MPSVSRGTWALRQHALDRSAKDPIHEHRPLWALIARQVDAFRADEDVDSQPSRDAASLLDLDQ